MIKRTYQRSQILNYFELNDEQKLQAVDQCDERAENGQFVLWKYPDETISVLPLEMFMRSEDKVKLFHGIYGTSYFSAWLLRINKTGEEATVVYCHW